MTVPDSPSPLDNRLGGGATLPLLFNFPVVRLGSRSAVVLHGAADLTCKLLAVRDSTYSN